MKPFLLLLLLPLSLLLLDGCADCGKSDKPAGAEAITNDAGVRIGKLPTEMHPLAPFIDAGVK